MTPRAFSRRVAASAPARWAALAAIGLLCGCTSTYHGRWIVWNLSGIEDHLRSPSEPVAAAAVAFRFTSAGRSYDIEVEIVRRGRVERLDLDALGRATHATAILVVHRDMLLFEGYFNGYDRESVNTSFSVAKSVTSLLVGTALDRGFGYRRAWWLSLAEPGIGPAVGAWGRLGQYIPVIPELDLVVVRFGRKTGGVSWPAAFREIARAVLAANEMMTDG